jgi:hypothetical protein
VVNSRRGDPQFRLLGNDITRLRPLPGDMPQRALYNAFFAAWSSERY